VGGGLFILRRGESTVNRAAWKKKMGKKTNCRATKKKAPSRTLGERGRDSLIPQRLLGSSATENGGRHSRGGIGKKGGAPKKGIEFTDYTKCDNSLVTIRDTQEMRFYEGNFEEKLKTPGSVGRQ